MLIAIRRTNKIIQPVPPRYSSILSQRTKKTSSQSDYEYIQKSKIPTMHFQASLPRLPIPKLEDSGRRYLNALQPLLEDIDFVRSCKRVDKFIKNEGQNLQKELIRRNKLQKHTSYISAPWFDMYLRDRKPLPINYNPFLVFSPESNTEYNQQLVKATNLVISSIRFLKSLRSNLLEPEVFHINPKKSDTQFFRTFTGLLPSSIAWYGAYLMNAYPLDMSQYGNLFNSTRIPLPEKDTIIMDTSARHIVVIRNGRFYSFDVLNEDGSIVSPQLVAANIKHILEKQVPWNEQSVGVLTASDRNLWATARAYISELGNQNIFKIIDSAAFVLILENESIGSDQNKLLTTFLHGKAENRWFDKSFSAIITKDGFSGINFEHSWGDGVAVLRYFQDVKKDFSEKPQFQPDDQKYLDQQKVNVKTLEFNIDEKIKTVIMDENSNYKKRIDQLDIGFLIYEGFGKKECKSFGVSPDAVMQLVFQLALFKQELKSVATYESCSTAAFKHGRTETIRPCTQETKNLCSTLIQNISKMSTRDIKRMIIECSNAHNKLTKEAAMGQGFDRHLFALRKIAESFELEEDIFTDPAYEMINHNILSTSTLSSPVVIAGGFGPVVPDGYGIGYMIQDQRLGTVVTSYKNYRSAKEYVQSMESSFKDIHKVLLRND